MPPAAVLLLEVLELLELLELALLLLLELLDELLELSLERPELLPEVPPELEPPELLELLPDALLPLEPLPELPLLDPLPELLLPELLLLEPLPELPPFFARTGVLARLSAVRAAMMATVFFSLNMMEISWVDSELSGLKKVNPGGVAFA